MCACVVAWREEEPFTSCLPGDTGRGSGAHARRLHSTRGSFLRRRGRARASRILVRATSPLPAPERGRKLPSPSGPCSRRLAAVRLSGSPRAASPRYRRHGAAEAGPPLPGPGRPRRAGLLKSSLRGPGSDIIAGRGRGGHLASNPHMSLVGKLRHGQGHRVEGSACRPRPSLHVPSFSSNAFPLRDLA